MKINAFKLIVYVLLGCLPALGVWSCQSDAASGSQGDAVADESGSATGGAGKARAEAMKKMKEGLDRAQKLEQEFDQFHRKVLALQEQVSRLPEASKKNAADFSELDMRFSNYLEKGAFTKTEVHDLVFRLDYQVNPPQMEGGAEEENNDEDLTPGTNWEQRLQEFEVTKNDYWEKYKEIEAAVAKLNRANGAPVTLFQ